MKIIKKIISLILTVAIIATLYVFSSASENITIYSDSTTAVAGETISIPIKISNNTGFMGFSIILEFDDTVFTPVFVEAGDVLSNGSLSDSIGGTMQSNIVKVVYTDSSAVTANGELFSVTFNVSESAVGNYEFKISYLPKDTFDENFDYVSFFCEDISIFIENDYIENAVKFDGGSFSVNAGEILTVPVLVSNAVEMVSFEIDISYNQKVFEFVGYNMGEIIKNGSIDVSENQSQISFMCLNSSVAQDGNLLYIRFKVAEYIEKHEEILISCKSVSFADGSSKQSVCYNSSITINNPYADQPAFIYSDSSVLIVDNYIDIPVYISNNHGVMGFGIDIDYDSAILEAVSVTKGEVLGTGNFEDNIENISDNIKIRWNNSVNVVENGLLFTLRFNILDPENLNTIPIDFTYSQSDTYNEKWEDVELVIEIGTITAKQEYTIRFVADGDVVSTQKFITGMAASEIELPKIPLKSGYNGSWEAFSLGDKDIDVNCIYMPIVYTATFLEGGKIIGTDTFTVEDESLDYPYIIKWAYYDWVWDGHKIEANDLTIEGRYVPITYTITFVSNGTVIKTQDYNVNTANSIVAPAKSLPAKQHYTTEWEDWTGKIGNITVNEIYVPIKYRISFYCQEKLVATRSYTIETSESQILLPDVPKVDGYDVKWSELRFEYKDQNVYAVYTPIIYTAQFVADGVIIATQTFTVETEKLDEPPVPQKAGYYACWSAYTIEAKDITIVAKYHLPEVVTVSKRTLDVGDTFRLLPTCNFEVTEKSWVSSDTSVATVSSHGKVTAVGKGECEITTICYGKDSLGNDIHASKVTKIIVNDDSESKNFKQSFREMFDEFFEVTLHDLVYNLREFMLVLLRHAY